jgi:hypothetical protein
MRAHHDFTDNQHESKQQTTVQGATHRTASFNNTNKEESFEHTESQATLSAKRKTNTISLRSSLKENLLVISARLTNQQQTQKEGSFAKREPTHDTTVSHP